MIGDVEDCGTTDLLTIFVSNKSKASMLIGKWMKGDSELELITEDNCYDLVGETIEFNASASSDTDGKIVTYVWDFGDETSSKEELPTITHSYASAGDYTVKLKVVDDHGISSSNNNTMIIPVVAPS